MQWTSRCQKGGCYMNGTWSLASPATLAALLLAATLVAPGTYAQEQRLVETPRQLSLERKPWQGDFDAMLERRLICVLIPYSRTLYFNDRSYWIPGSSLTNNSMSAPSNALPRLRTLCTNLKNPR